MSPIGVGMATLRRVDRKYLSAVLLGFVLPAGAVVSTAINSALPALQLSAANPAVQAALEPVDLLVVGARTGQRIPVPGAGGGIHACRRRSTGGSAARRSGA